MPWIPGHTDARPDVCRQARLWGCLLSSTTGGFCCLRLACFVRRDCRESCNSRGIQPLRPCLDSHYKIGEKPRIGMLGHGQIPCVLFFAELQMDP